MTANAERSAADSVSVTPGGTARVGIIALCAVALAYQLATVGRQGLWLDELFVAVATDPRQDLATLFRDYLITEPHPPGYYLLMYAWRQVTPQSDLWLRLPGSIVYGLTVLAAAFYPCWQLAGERRLLFVGLVACSFGTIYFSQEVRMYALMALVAIPVTLEAANLFCRIRSEESVSFGACAWMVVLGLLASALHYFSFLYFGATILTLTGYALIRRREAVKMAAIGTVVLAAMVPWLLFNFAHVKSLLGGAFWITFDLVKVGRGFLRHLVGGAVPLLLLLALLAFAAWRKGWRLLVEAPVIGLVAASAALVLLVAMLVSLHTPILEDRYLSPLRPPLYFAVALAAGDLLADRRARWLVLATVAAFLVSAMAEQKPKTSWREPSDFIRANTSCTYREILRYPTFDDAHANLDAAFRWYLPEPRFVLKPSDFGPDVAAELAALNPTAPGCDVVALAFHLNPSDPKQTEAVLRRTPFAALPYRLYHWPGAFVVRRVTP